MFRRFSPGAREVVIRAGDLAAAAGRDRIGTEFVLLALCEDAALAPTLERHGVIGPAAQHAIAAALSRPRPYSDRELLATLGIDLDEVRRRMRALGEDEPFEVRRSVLWPLRVAVVGPGRDLPFTGGGRKVLEVASWRARRRGRTPVEPADLLHGLLADGRSNAIRVLRHLRVDVRGLVSSLDRRAA
ncbi:Clp amino terminal domain-containing protein, pathogenicity island component [Thermomonospora echinospora]|uniref:Clp amino terminal domain-containing protein, pathogenicity island component n=1 Tax=Thermomonospora echinospora TaxID=1992 RepID=A0A1H6C2L1_9ACTN|nr:Clp protease N-terminal domain-containing protein [Thermomonospora echinospora]SEG67240.1 Clp amino terminal domain-containing protein, pathogenicity island component [Thermomonospora echinospora]